MQLVRSAAAFALLGSSANSERTASNLPRRIARSAIVPPMSDRSILTIGNFDGVHVGHAALVRTARSLAKELGAPAVTVLAFDPHPARLLVPHAEPARLSTFAHRAELLRAAGADHVVRLEPTRDLLELSPNAFLDWAVTHHSCVGIVEGHDFHFGRGRAGTPRILQEFGRERSIAVKIEDALMVDLCDQTTVRASSTIIRWLLAHGRVTDAHRVLGRPFVLGGTVVRGDQRGRTLGFPTANLDPASLGGVVLPRDGVYAGLARLPGAARAAALPAAVHIGPRATVGSHHRVVEVHVIGWNGPAPEAEYHWPLSVGLLAHLREPMKFDGVGALKEQIARDRDRAAQIAAAYNGPAVGGAPAARSGARSFPQESLA